MTNRPTLIVGAAVSLFTLLAAAPHASAQWVNFNNETSTRLVSSALDVGVNTVNDTQEKDFAWGDVDQDGDIDLVCVRKQPFTSTGRRINALFMNEGIPQGHSINGVLINRAAQYAQAVDLNGDGITDPQPAGDMGFNTATNDRDVVLSDVNNDGWLDIVTAVTLSDGQPKIISHPRVYMNLKEVAGVWQGFRYEPNRIPNLVPAGENPNAAPRFCSVAAGDVTGDGYVDLYFGDYNAGGVQLYDFNNRLLINGGPSNPGVFTDSVDSRISALRRQSAFGAASVIADMNNDGALDIVKQTSLDAPTHVAIHHNNPSSVGMFPDAVYKFVDQNSPYFVSAGDLNNDGRLDLVTTDDGSDRYYINTGNSPAPPSGDGTANFAPNTFLPAGVDDGFGSQNLIVDLNNDNWNDVLISDVDVDISGCGRRLHIYRNLGNAPNVSLQQQDIGGLANSFANMGGTHNVAAFDINGDGWKDLVIGRCTGTFVWMGVPPVGVSFTYPGGLPAYITPNQTSTFDVQLSGISGATVTPNTGKIYISVGGGPFAQSPMTHLGGNLYRATLPAVSCTSRVRFYVSGDYTTLPSGGGTKFDPPTAPTQWYQALAALGTEITLDDTIEGSTAGWAISNGPGLTAGTWEPVDPNATFFSGAMAAPEDDATGGTANVKAFVTLNGTVGGAAGASDIDGGVTYLVSPVIDLTGSDATISYSRWFFASLTGNSLTTQVSNNNGASWVNVDSVTATIADNTQVPPETVWQTTSFIVGQYLAPTSQVRVRFVADGSGATAVVEAGIDNLQVQQVLCTQPCLADITGDAAVNINDLLSVINSWGPCSNPNDCPADISPAGPPVGDDMVNINDLLDVINAWGSCP